MGSLTLTSTTVRVATVNMDTINSGGAPDDWGAWLTGGFPPDQRRNGGGSTLSSVTLVGGGGGSTTATEPQGISWTNGTPTASGSSTNDFFNSNFTTGAGFSGTAPADTNPRTIWFLVNPYNLINGTMNFSLSDASASPITNTTALVATTSSATTPYLVVVTYQANSALQTLNYQFTTQGASTVTLQAIAVAITAPSGPTINTQPASQSVYLGQTATFTVSATTSGGSLSYQWQQYISGSWTNVGTNSSSYTTGATGYADNGDLFQVLVTDSNGTTTSATAVLTVIGVASVAWLQ